MPAHVRSAFAPQHLGFKPMASVSLPIHSLATATLGVPRIGPRRELKSALEAHWAGRLDEMALEETAAALRAAGWARQHALGITQIPSGDFSLYDHVLDTAVMVGAIPERFGWSGGPVPLATRFAMARGTSSAGSSPDADGCGHAGHDGTLREGGVAALEMTKWFDTNYHYLVPELTGDQRFTLADTKPLDHFLEAKALGYHTRPVLLGPVTFLKLAKAVTPDVNPLALLDRLVPVYADLLARLAEVGADWVQIDEPCLAGDIDAPTRTALHRAYSAFARAVPDIRVLLATYFGPLGDALDLAVSLPVAGLHADLVRAPGQLVPLAERAPREMLLSLGVVDGRNVWRTDLSALLDRLEPVVATRRADRIEIAPSCSLLHVPVDLAQEDDLDPEIASWLAFGVQKMEELQVIATALQSGRDAVGEALAASHAAVASRAASPHVHDAAVAARLAAVTPRMSRRESPFADRAERQRRLLDLPAFPTTTIGSFPQTAEVRKARAAHARGRLSDGDYEHFLAEETARAIRFQEEIGLDVLVHGEFERNDMVQYFGERLSGFAFTRNAWVQSYGSRCVRPPIVYGDVARPKPMTVARWQQAQALTRKPLKGMLTGPVTILNWSFVRDDLPRETVCRQIALAIRDEVRDLEAASARIIQIDEAALREGLPLRKDDWPAYLGWATEAFRLSACVVSDETQIHTHMCYSEFNDILDAIAGMDADVISIETSRSHMELLGAFRAGAYPNEIGPGVYDIHSPRVPPVEEMAELLRLARERLADDQLWVNPDCGLKTRGWPEVRAALANMVAAAREIRAELSEAAE